MKKLFNIFSIALVAVAGLTFSACNDDDDATAKNVLASVKTLQCDAQNDAPKIITVYADGEWSCQHPDWITVEPERGNGVTEVRISVADNMRDGSIDNPRKDEIVFKGVTKVSEARVVVRQNGDMFRDVAPITIARMEKNEDESVAIIENLTVAAMFNTGFIVTDGTNNAYVVSDAVVVPGQAVKVYGERASDGNNMPVLSAHKVEVGGNVSSLPEAVDITETIEKYASGSRNRIKITGKVDGSNIMVADAENRGFVTMATNDVNLASLNGHLVTVTGFYAGTATPAVNIYATDVEDHGIVEVVYFSEDFEWLEPWVTASGSEESVVADNLDAKSTACTTAKAVDPLDGKEKTAFVALEDRGYVMLYDKNDNKRIYLNKNYLKMGKTGNHAGIQLKPITDVPAGEHCVLSFDWSGMRQGSGKIDPVHLYVKIINGTDELEYDIPELGWENDHKLEWVRATVDLAGVTVNENTKIQITQREWGVATANRWFIDNIKIIQAN